MAANAARTIQAVRPHLPMIRFPLRGVQAAQAAAPAVQRPSSNSSQSPSSTVLPSYAKPFGTTERGTGVSYSELPQRFRRQPLDEIEIEYITRGGPE